MGEPRKVELPASLMDSVRVITTSEDMPPFVRLQGVLMLIHGWAWFSEQVSVNPRAIALPRKQWLEVCELLTNGVGLDSLAGVNLGIAFMDKGPSAE